MERKWLAHFIDANFGKSEVTNYRLGKDIEEYNIELNGEIEEKTNILGENSVVHKGYKPTASVDTFYAKNGDTLSDKLMEIVNERLKGDDVRTTVVDVIMDDSGKVVSAYREEVVIDVKSIGGSTEVNIPFDIHYAGNRVKGTFDTTTKIFTVGTAAAASTTTEE
ncbi:MAG: hypothetical protein J6B87_02885 [Clostridia bacterium]|nr:hypothetical protein [Clostridia bacterium]